LVLGPSVMNWSVVQGEDSTRDCPILSKEKRNKENVIGGGPEGKETRREEKTGWWVEIKLRKKVNLRRRKPALKNEKKWRVARAASSRGTRTIFTGKRRKGSYLNTKKKRDRRRRGKIYSRKKGEEGHPPRLLEKKGGGGMSDSKKREIFPTHNPSLIKKEESIR